MVTRMQQFGYSCVPLDKSQSYDPLPTDARVCYLHVLNRVNGDTSHTDISHSSGMVRIITIWLSHQEKKKESRVRCLSQFTTLFCSLYDDQTQSLTLIPWYEKNEKVNDKRGRSCPHKRAMRFTHPLWVARSKATERPC